VSPPAGTVRVLPTPDELARAVAEALIGRIAEVQADGRVPAIALTGGSIARAIHRAAASSVSGLDVDWSQVDVWFGDERYVDAWSEDRNARQARLDLLDHVEVDPQRVHEMPAADSGLPLDEAAAAYADEVRAGVPDGFDLVMLGMGPDGHVASLFPGFPQLDEADAAAVPVTGSPKPPPERISLTYPVLNDTRATWFLVTSADKRDVATLARGGAADRATVPAAGISPARAPGELVWWLDRAAAGS